MKIDFTKMHGAGNDYIYIDGAKFPVPAGEKPEIVRKLSAYHFGIGSDGVIFINPGTKAMFEMEMYNRDGSRGEMCGNGIRCVGKFVYDHGLVRNYLENKVQEDVAGRISPGNGGVNPVTDDAGNPVSDAATVTDGNKPVSITVESFGKVHELILYPTDGRVRRVRVDMGAPLLASSEVPVLVDRAPGKENDPVIDEPIDVLGRTFRMTCANTGVPHTVVFPEEDLLPDGNIFRMDISKYGPAFESHVRFPKKVNTEFLKVVDRQHVDMRVWERGSGETLACGTGTCAACVACVLNGYTDRAVDVRVVGGVIHVEWDEQTGHVFMTGPAAESFEGTVDTELLEAAPERQG